MEPPEDAGDRVLTIPNALSVLRLLLVPVFIYLLLVDSNAWAVAVLMFSGFSDWADGKIARMVDKSRSHVANLQRLLSLPEPVIEMVEDGRLSMGHARALIGVEDAAAVAQNAVERRLSVREVEQLVRRQTRPAGPPRRARGESHSAATADIAAVQNHLEEFLGLGIRINTDADPRSGNVTIRYRTLDQLDLICQRLTGGGI
jgi:ParB family chromosome partitioning protein